MFDSVRRLPRSYGESPTWVPDWRNQQATAYLLAFQTRVALASVGARNNNIASALIREVQFPEWEDDVVVKARFWHAVGAPVPGSRWTQAFDWCQECVRMDPATQSCVALKGWLVAGLSDEEISYRRPITPFHVKVFHDTWFDVRGHLRWPESLLQVLCARPTTAETPEWERRERTIIRAALADGPEAVDRLVIPSDKLSKDELKWLVEHRAQVQARLCWDRTHVNAAAGFTRNTDITLHQEDQRVSVNRDLAQAKVAMDNKSDEKYRSFFDELSTVWEEHGAVSDASEFFASEEEASDKITKISHKKLAKRVI